ncbi:MAG TPA: PDGLE domain-containing protein [bacterium]
MNKFFKKYRVLLIILLIIAALTPVAYYAAERLNFGETWGEWSAEEVKMITGKTSTGMKDLEGMQKIAPLPDYSIPGHSIYGGAAWYFLSAVAGALILILVFLAAGRIIGKGANSEKG